jgi:hypothetical protein
MSLERIQMKTITLSFAIAVAMVAAPATQLAAQVQINVPEVVPGAKPVVVERIKVHGEAKR